MEEKDIGRYLRMKRVPNWQQWTLYFKDFLRLPFGIHSTQEVFDGIINGSFIDIIGVETDLDDFLIWGKNTEDHNRSLIASLERVKKIGVTMNLDKC